MQPYQIYFSKFYQTYLFEKIPSARKKICIKNGKLVGFRELQDTITNMVSESEFFKYANERFYNKLKNKCIDFVVITQTSAV